MSGRWGRRGRPRRAQLRGGVGLTPIEASLSFSDIKFTVELPSTFTIAGIDFFSAASGFRPGGGVTLKLDDPAITGEFTGTVDIGNRTYAADQVGMFSCGGENRSLAPYVMVGLGRHASGGTGCFSFWGGVRRRIDGRADGGRLHQARRGAQKEPLSRSDKYKIYPIGPSACASPSAAEPAEGQRPAAAACPPGAAAQVPDPPWRLP